MDLYILVTNLLVLVLVLVLLRYSLYRIRYFLHMFQLVGYKTSDFRNWCMENMFPKVISGEHVFFNIVIFIVSYFLSRRITLTSGTIVVTVFALFWFGGRIRYKTERVKKPLVFTARMKRLTALVAVLILPLWYGVMELSMLSMIARDFAAPFVFTDPYFLGFGLVFVDIFIPLLIFLAGWVTKPLEWSIQQGFKKKAIQKLNSLPNLKVIAITGSYGKTSTKFIIDTFLSQRYSVCMTPGSYNTPMGICKVINNDLNATHDMLILEMGARYRGNIDELCDIARPDASVVTNVGVSHLKTLGSVKGIAEEKGTVVRRTKPGGAAILNGDDPAVAEMEALRDDIQIILTGDNGSIRAEEIRVSESGTSFEMVWLNEDGTRDQSEQITTRLLGAHNIQNILLGAAVARLLGVRLKTIAVAAASMEPVEHRLELKQREGLTVIDDAFNSNPVGAKSALDVLGAFSGRKRVIITPGMIELGEKQDELNERFGRQIAESGIDVAILVGEEQTRPIYRGIQRSKAAVKPDVHIVSSLFEANELLRKTTSPGDVVLYENDLPDTFND